MKYRVPTNGSREIRWGKVATGSKYRPAIRTAQNNLPQSFLARALRSRNSKGEVRRGEKEIGNLFWDSPLVSNSRISGDQVLLPRYLTGRGPLHSID